MTPSSPDPCCPGSGPEMAQIQCLQGFQQTQVRDKKRSPGGAKYVDPLLFVANQTSQTSLGLCQPVTLGRTHSSEVCDGSDSQGLCLWMPTVHD